jgi:hypothetical protein
VLLAMKAHVQTTTMPSIEEAARRVKPLLAESHREVPGLIAHKFHVRFLIDVGEGFSSSVAVFRFAFH